MKGSNAAWVLPHLPLTFRCSPPQELAPTEADPPKKTLPGSGKEEKGTTGRAPSGTGEDRIYSQYTWVKKNLPLKKVS